MFSPQYCMLGKSLNISRGALANFDEFTNHPQQILFKCRFSLSRYELGLRSLNSRKLPQGMKMLLVSLQLLQLTHAEVRWPLIC